MVSATQQTKSNAAVISLPEEDLFVVYKGVNSAGAYSMDVRINPLINFVWAGFFILIAGAAFAGMGRRAAKKEEVEAAQHEIDVEEAELAEERALAAAEAKAAKAEASAEKRAGKVSDVKNDK
jgi:cytochrome c-type biogenesis protein CcmF